MQDKMLFKDILHFNISHCLSKDVLVHKIYFCLNLNKIIVLNNDSAFFSISESYYQ